MPKAKTPRAIRSKPLPVESPPPPPPVSVAPKIPASHAPTLPKDAPPPKIERTTLPLASLVPAPYNPRKISDEAKAGLKASLDRFGLVQEIVVNRRTMHIVGGDKRAMTLREEGVVDVPVVLVNLSDDEEKALNVALNNPQIQGEFDGSLAQLLGGMDKSLLEGLRTDELVQSLEEKLSEGDDEFKKEFEIEEFKVAPPPKMIWSLVAVPAEKWNEIAPLIEEIGKLKGVILDTVVR